MSKPPPAKRPWFPVARGLKDHFDWMRGGRLRVFLVILEHTNAAPIWVGWSVSQVAKEARVGRARARDILRALGAERTVKGDKRRRAYIKLEMGHGGRSNRLTVANWIRTVTNGKQGDLDYSSATPEPPQPQNVDNSPAQAGVVPLSDHPPLVPDGPLPWSQATTQGPSNLRDKFKALQRLSVVSLARAGDPEDSEEYKRENPATSSLPGTGEEKQIATHGSPSPDHHEAEDPDGGAIPSEQEVAAIIEGLRAELPPRPRRRP